MTMRIPRRRLLAAAGFAGLCALTAARGASAQTLDEIERSNIALVNEFCAAWEARDLKRITSFLADDVVFRLSEASPATRGLDAVSAQLQPIVDGSTSIDFEIVQTFAAGSIVINHRIDRLAMKQPITAEVVGVFFVKDGKIKERSDYSMPKPLTSN